MTDWEERNRTFLSVFYWFWLKSRFFWNSDWELRDIEKAEISSDSVIRCWRDCVCGEQSLFRSLRIRLPGISRCKARLVPSRLCYKLVYFIQKSGINSKNLFRHETEQIFVFSAPKFDIEPIYIQKIFFIKCLLRGWGCGVGHAGKAGFNLSRRVRRSRELGFVG